MDGELFISYPVKDLPLDGVAGLDIIIISELDLHEIFPQDYGSVEILSNFIDHACQKITWFLSDVVQDELFCFRRRCNLAGHA